MKFSSATAPVVLPFAGERDRPDGGRRPSLAELKELLAEKFPQRARAEGERFACGLPAIDEALGGGLPQGAVSEIVAAGPSCGGQVLLASLLDAARRAHRHVALVDGSDGFDPQSADPAVLPHLLWVRCRQAAPALQAADLLVRDGNLSPILLDLRGNAAAELRQQPSTIWYRLQRAVEQSGGILLVLTAAPLVASAAARLVLRGSLPLEAIDEPDLAPARIVVEVARETRGRHEERKHSA